MKQFKLYSLALSLLGLGFIMSCNELTEVEPTPAYIHVDEINLSTTPEQGSNSHKILDAWLFAESQLIGVFELPFTAPVLVDGTTEVEIFAGVADNGISSFREVYPYYARFRVTKELAAGRVDTITPTVNYDNRTEFKFIETFESSNIFGDDIDGSSETRIELWQAEAFEGNRSGRIQLDGNASFFEAGTSNFYELPIDEISNPIYLELNYKNDVAFEIGIAGIINGQRENTIYVVGVNPREEWNKIYIDLTDSAIQLDADFYQITLRALLPSGESAADIFIDNVKLLHL